MISKTAGIITASHGGRSGKATDVNAARQQSHEVIFCANAALKYTLAQYWYFKDVSSFCLCEDSGVFSIMNPVIGNHNSG